MVKGKSLECENLKCYGIIVRKIEENGFVVIVYYFDKYFIVDYVLFLRYI